jgi:pyruvate dehydrogenase E2 component (dihydrolipoamide acetyltransferase)
MIMMRTGGEESIMREFKLPDLGEGMHEAEIRRWLVHPGDLVKQDQPMVEVETDKAVIEIPAPFAGQVAAILVPEGTMAKQGEVLITFDSAIDGEMPTTSSVAQMMTRETATAGTSPAQSLAATATQVVDPVVATPNTASMARHRVQAAPAVRKHAFELGIDLEQVPSSQPSGRITMEDVQNYASRTKVATLTAVAPATTVVHTPQPPTTAQTNGASATASTAPTATLPTHC